MSVFVNVGGVDKLVKPLYINVGGVDKEIKQGFVNVGGVDKKFYQSFTMPSGIVILSKAVLAEGTLCDGNNGTLNLIGRFLRTASAQGNAGGASTHTHSYSGSSGDDTPRGTSRVDTEQAIVYLMTYHTHTINHTHAAFSNDPPYKGLIPYVGASNLVSDMLFFMYGSVPSKWLAQPDYYNKYAKLDSDGSGSGGSASHGHSYSGSSGSTFPSSSSSRREGGSGMSQRSNHSHTINHTHADLAVEPPYYSLVPMSPDGATDIPSGACAFFVGDTVPAGWSYFSLAEGRFIKMSSASGAIGGVSTHGHAVTASSGSYSTSVINRVSTSNASTENPHTHTINHTHSAISNIPLYQDLLFCKKD